MKCKTCKHYPFYKMLDRGERYGYAGQPCLICSQYPELTDNYEPIEPKEVGEEPHYNKDGRV